MDPPDPRRAPTQISRPGVRALALACNLEARHLVGWRWILEDDARRPPPNPGSSHPIGLQKGPFYRTDHRRWISDRPELEKPKNRLSVRLVCRNSTGSLGFPKKSLSLWCRQGVTTPAGTKQSRARLADLGGPIEDTAQGWGRTVPATPPTRRRSRVLAATWTLFVSPPALS